MNLILIQPSEWPTSQLSGELTIKDHRFDYIKSVHQPQPGDFLRVGLVQGKIGTAEVLELHQSAIKLSIKLERNPPAASPATLILALPRPKVLRRTLQMATTLGVKEIYLINSYRVEKSFWQSPFLSEDSIHQQLLLGLEQAQDTDLPKVHLKKRFKPFVEDELSSIVTNKDALVAHPKDTDTPFPNQITAPTCIAIGPEGGFIPYEIELLQSIGFRAKYLGPRILKVETAVAVTLGRCLAS
ncbi:MAG: 16S rRNA (uracil(1498)-N(3))-methyltransferase [Pseudomonadales bacterium]|nr:16S rRNA (uracil(1498)-N(3))-methyltransferase [Pseudomonadales bacterium]